MKNKYFILLIKLYNPQFSIRITNENPFMIIWDSSCLRTLYTRNCETIKWIYADIFFVILHKMKISIDFNHQNPSSIICNINRADLRINSINIHFRDKDIINVVVDDCMIHKIFLHQNLVISRNIEGFWPNTIEIKCPSKLIRTAETDIDESC